MKLNKGLVIAITAGVAVAGFVTYLLANENGRKTARKWKMKAQEMISKAEGYMEDTKQKYAGLKNEFKDELKTMPRAEEHFQ
ncbi:MAG TPA: YtxH domain-containing protein [Flavisolibacter sp.]